MHLMSLQCSSVLTILARNDKFTSNNPIATRMQGSMDDLPQKCTVVGKYTALKIVWRAPPS